MGDQTAAALSRSGRDVASVVTLRPGAPDAASSLWIGPAGGQSVEGTDGRTLTRPSWALDDAVWVVVDGINVVRVIQEAASGQPARIPVDSAALTARFPGVISELQLSRDGTRAAMVIDGQVILAGVEQTPAGEFALTYPRRLGFGLGSTVISLSWRTGDDMVVTRTDPAHPVSYVNLDGVNSDGPSNNLLPPMSAVAANPSAVYVADARGVLQLSGTNGENSQTWSEVRPSWRPAPCRCCRAEEDHMVLPGVVRQIGYVVTDFDRTLAGLIELGIGPWFVLRGIEQSGLYRGEPCTVTLTIGFANSGDMQFEVIHQDNDVRSIYREFTDAGHDGYHQLAYWAEDFDAALAAERRGGLAGGLVGRAGRVGPLRLLRAAHRWRGHHHRADGADPDDGRDGRVRPLGGAGTGTAASRSGCWVSRHSTRRRRIASATAAARSLTPSFS